LSLIWYSTNFIKVQTPCVAIHLQLGMLRCRLFLQQHCHLLLRVDIFISLVSVSSDLLWICISLKLEETIKSVSSESHTVCEETKAHGIDSSATQNTGYWFFPGFIMTSQSGELISRAWLQFSLSMRFLDDFYLVLFAYHERVWL
jgi:hypothetical protein